MWTYHDKGVVGQRYLSLYLLRLLHQNLPLTRLLQGLVPVGPQRRSHITAHIHQNVYLFTLYTQGRQRREKLLSYDLLLRLYLLVCLREDGEA